jgi:hypothetical protein
VKGNSKMKALITLALALAAIPAVAQVPVKQQRCYAQACTFSTWNPVVPGDTLVAIIRPAQKEKLPCQAEPQGCGGGELFLVADLSQDQWQRAYSKDPTSQVWFALDAKPGLDIVVVMASFGYNAPGYSGPRGDFAFDVYMMEFPRAIGIDLPSQKATENATTQIDAGTVTATTSKTLLIAWTDNLAFADSPGPFTMTPSDRRFTVLSDDGTLAIATALVDIPGAYSFTATYNGTGFWRAGLVALQLE